MYVFLKCYILPSTSSSTEKNQGGCAHKSHSQIEKKLRQQFNSDKKQTERVCFGLNEIYMDEVQICVCVWKIVVAFQSIEYFNRFIHGKINHCCCIGWLEFRSISKKTEHVNRAFWPVLLFRILSEYSGKVLESGQKSSFPQTKFLYVVKRDKQEFGAHILSLN